MTTGPLRFSNSEIQDFKRCKRKWYLTHYRGLRPKADDFAGKPMYIGSRIHDALAAYYDAQMPENRSNPDYVPVDPLRLLEDSIHSDAEKFPEKSEQLDKDLDLCMAVMEGYFDWLEEEGADEDLEFLGSEIAVVAPLGNEFGDELIGKIDARVRRRSDGSRLFIDHKTCAGFGDIEKMSPMSEQFMQYGLLERLAQNAKSLEYRERTDGGIYNMLRKSKRTARATPPFYKRLEVRHNDETLRSFYLRVYGTVMDIRKVRERLDAGEDHRVVCYPTPESSCSWQCPFFLPCKMFDDGSPVESFLQEYYTTFDPLERYDGTPQEIVGSTR